jgi:hypothetical protein
MKEKKSDGGKKKSLKLSSFLALKRSQQQHSNQESEFAQLWTQSI